MRPRCLASLMKAPCLMVTAALLLVPACQGSQPVALLAFWDASASSQPYQANSQHLIEYQIRRLIPADSIGLYRVSQDVLNIYSGPPLGKSLKPSLEGYFRLNPAERGTALGPAFELAIKEAQVAHRHGFRPVLLFLGDMAAEAVPDRRPYDWSALSTLVEGLPPESSIICAFSEPRFTETMRQSLRPVLGERLLLLNPQLASSPAGARLISRAIGR